MNRSADDIGQIIAGIQRDLEELKSNQGRSPIPDDSVTTAKIVDAAVTSEKIDWSTLTTGTTDTISSISAHGYETVTVNLNSEIEDAKYTVVATLSSGSAYWTDLRYRITSKTSTSFGIEVSNTASGSATNIHFDYVVIPRE